jgi:patatin-like phospholipase/acyl hydrolase
MNVSLRPVRVLSIDGGGIRGLIPALLLGYLEVTQQRSVADLFDLIVGTSTGGILALGLTVPGANGRPAFGALDLAELYPLWGKRIFPSGGPPTLKERLLGRGETFFKRMGNAARSVGGPFGGNPAFGGGARHTAAGLEEALDHYFGNARMLQALTEVAVTSFDTTRGIPMLFTRREARLNADVMNFEMRAVARATSAAPTYLPPQPLNFAGTTCSMVDGGVWANNPVMAGYLEAQRMTTERQLTADSVYIVSLGMGSAPATGGQFAASANWLSTFKNVAAMATDTNTNDALMRWRFPVETNRYRRFQTFEAAAVGGMDDPTPERLDDLLNATLAMIQAHKAEIDSVADYLARVA